MAVGIERFSNTYFIERSEHATGQGSLAIYPEVNKVTNIVSWQDTTSHAKSFRFSEFQRLEGRVLLFKGEATELRLIPLTVQIFKDKIHNRDVPVESLRSDPDLQDWYYEHYISQNY